MNEAEAVNTHAAATAPAACPRRRPWRTNTARPTAPADLTIFWAANPTAAVWVIAPTPASSPTARWAARSSSPRLPIARTEQARPSAATAMSIDPRPLISWPALAPLRTMKATPNAHNTVAMATVMIRRRTFIPLLPVQPWENNYTIIGSRTPSIKELLMEMSGDGRLDVTNLTSVRRCAIRRSAMMMLHPIAVRCRGRGQHASWTGSLGRVRDRRLLGARGLHRRR